VYLSFYLVGNPGARITAWAPVANTPFCQAGVVCDKFVKGLCVSGPPDPRLANCTACPNCSAPLEYQAQDVVPMVPYIDQFVLGGEWRPPPLPLSCSAAVKSWQDTRESLRACHVLATFLTLR
jgi:hypothetical protein